MFEMSVDYSRIKSRCLFVQEFEEKILFYEPPSGRAKKCLNTCRPPVFVYRISVARLLRNMFVENVPSLMTRHKIDLLVCGLVRDTWSCKWGQLLPSTSQTCHRDPLYNHENPEAGTDVRMKKSQIMWCPIRADPAHPIHVNAYITCLVQHAE